MSTINYSEKIPNNVNLVEDRTLQRALEQWQPNFINWWDDVGPEGSTDYDVYLRTAVSVDPQGWAQFGHVKMRDYRWGIFLNPGDTERQIHFGDHKGEKVWQEIPGEHRANLRRIIVTQGDTEPASVEQQRHLGLTAPSMYDLRNFFQINVEEGRHLWAMVYPAAEALRPRWPRRSQCVAGAPVGRPEQSAHPRRLQRKDARLAGLLHVHLLHRPRRQVPAVRPRRERVRPAGPHDQVHAHRRGASHVRGRERRVARDRANLPGDERAQDRRPEGDTLGRRHRSADHPALPELSTTASPSTCSAPTSRAMRPPSTARG